ncbi:MAG TPA: hypothetical protein VN894_04540 [Polyangiaceae bacterium]|nr:hypothetical protein [Polyangiaceae bacterium]
MPTDEKARRPVKRVRKRIERLVAQMRANPRTIAALATLVLAVMVTTLWQGQNEMVPRPNPFTNAAPPIPSRPPVIPSAAPVSSATAQHEPTGRELRRLAFIAYEDDRWAECLDYLDKARRVDPAGDTTGKVQTARRFSEEQLRKMKEKGESGDKK